MKEKISIIIPTLNRIAFLREQSRHFQEKLPFMKQDFEIIYIDGGSTDGSREFLATGQFEAVLETEKSTMVRALNKGLKIASGEYSFIFNDDAFFTKCDFDNPLQLLKKGSGIGLLSPYHSLTGNRGVWDQLEYSGKTYKTMHYDGIPFANFPFGKSEIFRRLCYLDEQYSFMAFDPDISLKVWELGLKVEPCRDILINHDGEHNTQRGDRDNKLRDSIWMERKQRIKKIMVNKFGLEPKLPGNK